MNLVKLREYEVPKDVRAKPIMLNLPLRWLDDWTKAGDVLGLYEHPETHELIIKKISTSTVSS